MDYTKLKDEIKEIANIATNVPEQFREKCFEILLTHLVAPAYQKRKPAGAEMPDEGETPESDKPKPDGETPMRLPAAVKAFMKRTGITADDLAKVVYFEDEELHFLSEPSTKTISRGQIEWGLLLAIRNAITGKGFEVDPEDLRSMCQEKGYYDSGNFWKAFKSSKNKAFFNGEFEAQGDTRKLTAAGQDELANVLRNLAA